MTAPIAMASTSYDAFDGQLVTTEWILTELADGLSGISDRQAFIDFHRALRDDPTVRIIPSSNELFAAGVELYATRPDKEWSLTDCISFVVMEREGLADTQEKTFLSTWTGTHEEYDNLKF